MKTIFQIQIVKNKSVNNKQSIKECKYVLFQFDFKDVIDEKNVAYYVFSNILLLKIYWYILVCEIKKLNRMF